MNIKIYEYNIVSAPDPLNPNEQPAGTVISDDRLYGLDRITVITQAQSFNKGEINKPVLSNTLSLLIGGQTFSLGQIVTITGVQTQPE